MLTQIVTFLIFVAIVGCILYGRRLIRTEKVDAVFGNPDYQIQHQLFQF